MYYVEVLDVPTVSARKLVPGMRLVRPVMNKNGLVMIGENTELTENLIGKIRDMGVDAVQVDGVARDLPPKDEMLAQLNNRFRKVETQPYMDVLKRLISEHIEDLYKEHGPENSQR